MMVPRTRSFDLFDSFFQDPFFTSKESKFDVMKTDIREKDNNYILDIDLPGVKKEDISIDLKDGYLTVNAKTSLANEDFGKNGTYLRRERYEGSFSRSFYAGENADEKTIMAEFKNGTLTISFPKDPEPKIEEKKTIKIN